MIKNIYLCVILLVQLSCNRDANTIKNERIREVTATEHAFMMYAKTNGLGAAFVKFADDNAVLSRGGKLIKGKSEIEEYVNSSQFKNLQLIWKPTFVDVSESGDLAYTYGNYTAEKKDENGKIQESKGIFHTVWKLQDNGEWKYVWD